MGDGEAAKQQHLQVISAEPVESTARKCEIFPSAAVWFTPTISGMEVILVLTAQ